MVAIGFAVAIGCVGGWLGWRSRMKELGTGKAPRGAVRCARHAGEMRRKKTTPAAAHGRRIATKPRLSGIKALMLPLQVLCGDVTRTGAFGIEIVPACGASSASSGSKRPRRAVANYTQPG